MSPGSVPLFEAEQILLDMKTAKQSQVHKYLKSETIFVILPLDTKQWI